MPAFPILPNRDHSQPHPLGAPKMHLPWPILTLPLIGHYPALHQSLILALLLLISYFHKRARYLLSGLVLLFLGYKTVVPIARVGYAVFKGVAMLGFYVHYFQVGVGVIMAGIGGVMIFLETVGQEGSERTRTGEL
ncbi:hypothetical protein FPV67DRAFT_1190689 [Lyophyllum atratum]|nr:hypothetical protein FPV67DRAFT_1190689 [Lyophyllum atratum]